MSHQPPQCHPVRWAGVLVVLLLLVVVHALSRLDTGYISATMRAVHDKSQPYDVPFCALVARDVRGLLVAGR